MRRVVIPVTAAKRLAASVCLALAVSLPKDAAGQERRLFQPEVKIQTEDYAAVRRSFRTTLTRQGPAPQDDGPIPPPPSGVSQIEYRSGGLRLKAWVSTPKEPSGGRLPAVLFLHGGFAFGAADWDMVKPYLDVGFTVMMPILRAENGQAGAFSMFYDEVDDVLAAADHLTALPFVDSTRVYLVGHSAGGTLALLAAQASMRFRAVASFDGSPDQQLLYNGSASKPMVPREVVFAHTDVRELEVRSPLAYAASFKCPARLYYSTQASPLLLNASTRTAAVAQSYGLDVEAIYVEGGHGSHVWPAVVQSIGFFRRIGAEK